MVFEVALMGTGVEGAADADTKEVEVTDDDPSWAGRDEDNERLARVVKADAAVCKPIAL